MQVPIRTQWKQALRNQELSEGWWRKVCQLFRKLFARKWIVWHWWLQLCWIRFPIGQMHEMQTRIQSRKQQLSIRRRSLPVIHFKGSLPELSKTLLPQSTEPMRTQRLQLPRVREWILHKMQTILLLIRKLMLQKLKRMRHSIINQRVWEMWGWLQTWRWKMSPSHD